MAELNFDKVLASLRLRLDEVTSEEEFDEITKEYLGKDSLLSSEKEKVYQLFLKEDKKTYGEKLNTVNQSISSNIQKAKQLFIDEKYTHLEDSENDDVSINWHTNQGSHRHILSQVYG